jgi:hypothetical protein
MTTRKRLPAHVEKNIRIVSAYGHQVVSQGCGLFRCTGCQARGWLDVAPEGQMVKACPAVQNTASA